MSTSSATYGSTRIVTRRGLFRRERRLLGLLARSARDTIVPIIRALLDRDAVTPGLVVSIRTFGSYAANFHPHVHALVPDGAFHQEGEFLPLPYFDTRLVEEGFRHHLHQRPHRTERLSEEFQRSLLCWVRSGFLVHGEQTVPADDLKGAESLVQERLDHAGVKVIEARIPHLAYAHRPKGASGKTTRAM